MYNNIVWNHKFIPYLCAICFVLITVFDNIFFIFFDIRIVQVERGSPNSMCLVESGRVSYLNLFFVMTILITFSFVL